ncbi:thiol peroxidase [Vagococcus xieshaowenii]|uniref:Thiol peroxidase n=1 Tax=Vagococcus xieshaowenii TaxID=2562451 RepID=A0A4Z0DB32_9ENTE|nr:thiol peroxidase [Vagococcus xieshaowenii]QCA28055.1 thiol peroxidase [Vagococcus xieshaowenii]TFZ42089.1 thiol peroxidase [Vagococcus xieshaowenii]
MIVTRKGEPYELSGTSVEVGHQAPTFTLNNLEDKAVSLTDLLAKPLLISVVPDIDTSVCSIQTKQFNQQAGSVEGIQLVTIAKNTKEELANWCAAEGVSMEMLHDEALAFGELYGIKMADLGVLARSIFVIDTDGTLVYQEIVPEMVNEPDYTAALDTVKALVK